MKRLTLLFLLIAYATIYTWDWVKTGYFSPSKIASTPKSTYSCNPPADLASILSQEFHYIGEGVQSYVFASADDQYVIKFVRHGRYKAKKERASTGALRQLYHCVGSPRFDGACLSSP